MAIASGWAYRGPRPVDVPLRIDQTDVAEGLGEVAEEFAPLRVDLLSQEAEVVGTGGQTIEERLRAA